MDQVTIAGSAGVHLRSDTGPVNLRTSATLKLVGPNVRASGVQDVNITSAGTVSVQSHSATGTVSVGSLSTQVIGQGDVSVLSSADR